MPRPASPPAPLDEPPHGAAFLLVRPAGRTHSEVKVLYQPGKGNG